MDKIEELKKLLWILDSKYNVSVPQTKENIDFIADEIVKLFCQPDVVGRSEQLICDICKSGLIDYPEINRRTCRCGGLGYNVTS